MAHTQSAAFQKETRFIELLTDVDCFVAVGVNPEATTTIGGAVRKVLADDRTNIAVEPGWKASAIMAAGTATLQIVEYRLNHHGNPNMPRTMTIQKVDVTT